MTWLPGVDGDGGDDGIDGDGAAADPFRAVLGLRPELRAAYEDFAAVFWERRLVDPVVLELCRLRVAQLLDCRSAQATRTPAALDAGLDEDLVGALAHWPTDARFSPLARAALALTEQFVLDPHAVTAEQRDAVTALVGDAGLVALVEALAVFDGFARFRNVLGVGTPTSGGG